MLWLGNKEQWEGIKNNGKLRDLEGWSQLWIKAVGSDWKWVIYGLFIVAWSKNNTEMQNVRVRDARSCMLLKDSTLWDFASRTRTFWLLYMWPYIKGRLFDEAYRLCCPMITRCQKSGEVRLIINGLRVPKWQSSQDLCMRVARGMQGSLINIWRFSRVCNVFQQLTCARQGG